MRWSGHAVRSVCGAVLLPLLLAAPLRAGEIVLQDGKRHRGFARIQGTEVHLNPYGCSAPEMTRGIRRFRRIDVREIRTESIADEIHRKLEELPAADVDRRVELLRLARAARMKPVSLRIAAEILRARPNHAEALEAVGGAEDWAAMQRGDPRLDPRVARALRGLLRLESGEARRREAAQLQEKLGHVAVPDRIERMVRSLGAERGVRRDVALRIEAKEFPGATYSLYVPEDYDPLVPRPLMLALHGGGIMHEKGASVRGSARDALAHFLDGARERGWFLCCPTAVEAPWGTTQNAAFLEAVLAEVTALWNVDLERLHLAGQGGGGDGVWYLARRQAARFASVCVAAAGKPSGVSAIVGKTALWIYHGEADPIVPVAPVRKAADGLLGRKAEFVYCELPKEEHGLPPAAKRDLFRHIGPKRRQKAESAWPAPSFALPTSKAALQALGDPSAAWGLGLPVDATADELLAIVAAGGPDAEPAARRLERQYGPARETLSDPLRAIVKDRERTRNARVWAAWLCGAWRDAQAIEELGNVLRAEKDILLLRHAAEAVGRIASPDSAQDVRWALLDVSRRYLGLKGKTVAFRDFERICHLGAAVAEAIGVVGQGDEDFFAELEEHLVRHVLMDPRPIRARHQLGEDVSEPRTRLAVALARAYRRLGAEKTLFDMLVRSVRRDRRATVAVQRVLRGR